MEELKRIVLEAEDSIVRSVMIAARIHGYGHHMPALEDSYRMGVSTISANLAQGLSVSGDVTEVSAKASADSEAIESLGARFARMRQGEGVDLALFLGLLKHYRHAYADAVRAADVERESERRYLATIDRYFDHLEMGFASTWSAFTLGDISASMIERNRTVTAEKNRCLSTFGDIPLPVLLLDERGRLENINAAAADLFSPALAGRGAYFPDRTRREAPPVLREEIRAFAESEARELSMEREIRTGKGTRYFEARLSKLAGFEGEYSGMLVVLTDLTYRRAAEDALRRSQGKYVSLFKNMLTALAYMKVVLDKRNRPVDYVFVEVNEAFELMVGQSASSIQGSRFTEVLRGIEHSRHDWMGALGAVAVTGENASFDALAESLGRWYSVSVYTPSPGYVTVMLSDISELKWVQESLAHSRDFYLTLFEGFPTLIWRAGPDGSHDYFNASWLEFTGRTLERSIGSGWLDDVHPDDRERRRTAITAAARERRPFTLEYRLRHHGGDYRWMLESGRPFDEVEGGFAGLIGSVQDISDRKRQEQQLEHLATHDELTNLPNRRVFEEALKRAVAHARRGHPSSLLFIDVDGFKDVNDSLGHSEGDKALVDIATRIHGVIRAEDLLSRIGGDEFAALLTDTVLADAKRVAERIRTVLREARAGRPDDSGGLTLSIGLVAVDGLAPEDTVLSQADAAMYRAKDSGGDRVVVFQPGFEPDPRDPATGSMLAKIKDALSRDGALLFHYQPVFRVTDGSIEYFEALTRLVDREQRVIPPGDFIGVAERFGLMPQLTRWVVGQAAAVLAANPTLQLAINLSGLDVEDAVLLDDVMHTLKARSVEPGRLSFEMSESSVLRDLGAAREWISRARDAGFGFALDDFGAGYNSFGYLRSLPVDRVKIDGSVTRSLVADPRQLTLLEAVRAVTSMSGVRTVAECVENEYVLEIVRDVGLDLAQGFHLGRPSSDLGGVPVDWSSRFPGARQD
ncbi:MAG: EAL domain-containing protein [Coriobacteriia bacterium]|nr:EAL domain-containing protein [Coriobacteriia bacterium]